ncbi:MAG: class I SAM-dependent methyltransferase [Planctomycetota bacterium]
MNQSPWYQQAFGAHYLQIYAHRSATQALHEIKSILPFLPAMDLSTSVLDLCCGSGRHLLALESLGFKSLIGVDLSEDLLSVAKQQIQKSHLVLADMRALPFSEKSFSAIFQFFTSFGYFSEEENQFFLKQIQKLLRPEGAYLLDYLNPEWVVSQLIPLSTTIRQNFFLREERRIRGSRVEKKVFLELPSKTIQYMESVRLYSQKEILSLFHGAGFSTIKIFGTFDGKPYDKNSPRMIVLAIRS